MIIKEFDRMASVEVTGSLGSMVVSRGRLHTLAQLPGYVAMIGDAIQGVVTYRICDGECEIVSLESMLEGQGIGTALIEKVMEKATASRCKRVWLITTNDNSRAIRFYQKRGLDMKAIHHNAVTEARKIKPSIPLVGIDGIPIRHEIEFEIVFD